MAMIGICEQRPARMPPHLETGCRAHIFRPAIRRPATGIYAGIAEDKYRGV